MLTFGVGDGDRVRPRRREPRTKPDHVRDGQVHVDVSPPDGAHSPLMPSDVPAAPPAALLEGGEKITTRWWVACDMQRYVYDLMIVRHFERAGQVESYEYTDGRWQRRSPGDCVRPALTLTAETVHTLVACGAFTEGPDVAEQLERLARDIAVEVLASATSQPERVG